MGGCSFEDARPNPWNGASSLDLTSSRYWDASWQIVLVDLGSCTASGCPFPGRDRRMVLSLRRSSHRRTRRIYIKDSQDSQWKGRKQSILWSQSTCTFVAGLRAAAREDLGPMAESERPRAQRTDGFTYRMVMTKKERDSIASNVGLKLNTGSVMRRSYLAKAFNLRSASSLSLGNSRVCVSE